MTSAPTLKQLFIAVIAVTAGLIFTGSPLFAQTVWDGSEPDDLWFTADNWDNGVVPNGATDEAVVGALSPTVTNGTVLLQSLIVTVDGVLTVGISQNFDFAPGAVVSLTNAGSITSLNNSDLQLLGMVDNTGSITIAAGLNFTDLEVAVGGATLTGGGTVTLSGMNAGITDLSGTQTLTIANQTIQGEGNIGRNSMDINNQADNLIDANVDTGTLRLDALDLFTNAGTLRASGGGILNLHDAGAGDFANAGGVIEALAGSEVQLSEGARIVGGVLQSVGSGVVRNLVSQNAELENLTFNGSFIAENNSDTRILGTITNTGSITIASGANFTNLEVAVGGATLTGGGTVILQGPNAGITDLSGTQTLTIANQTIRGTGNIGRNTLDIINSAGGTIEATMPGDVIRINPASSMTNSGTIRAIGGGRVEVDSETSNNGTIEAIGPGSIVQTISGVVIGGSLSAGATLRATNGGTLNLSDTGSLDGDLSASQSNAVLEFIGSDSSTDIFNNTFVSSELNTLGPSSPGNLKSHAFNSNAGLFRIGGGLNFIAKPGSGNLLAPFSNTGTIVAEAGSTFSAGGFSGQFITLVGSTNSLFVLQKLLPFVSTGTLAGSGTIANSNAGASGSLTADRLDYLESDGSIKPGDNPGETGTLTLISTEILLGDSNIIEIELGNGGYDAVDLITDTDPVALNGGLDVSLLAGYLPSAGDSFDIITAVNGLSGTFDTETLPTLSDGLEWLLDYAANTVTLGIFLPGDFDIDGDVDGNDFLAWQRGFGTDFDANDLADWQSNYGISSNSLAASAAVPEPTSLLLLVFGSIGIALKRRQ